VEESLNAKQERDLKSVSTELVLSEVEGLDMTK
jgi:hypothetical protein